VIDGVVITPLKQIRDDRGAIFHMLRTDDPYFAGFGEVYFSLVNPGQVKGWRRHTRMTMSLAVPKGRVKLVLADGNGEISELLLSDRPDEYKLVTIPPMIWNGFQCLGDEPVIIANCASIPHSPDEAEKLPLDTDLIGYVW
jgi:dTDP-4-dehydrorhamnose 3,5-epimerase